MSTRAMCGLFVAISCLLILRFSSNQALARSPIEDTKTGKSYVITINKEAYGDRRQEVTWDYAQTSWVSLYVRMCGKFCNGNQKIAIDDWGPDPPFCDELCYNCDCEVNCGMYGTCCPHVDPSTPLEPGDLHGFHKSKFMGNLSNLKLKDTNDFLEYVRSNPDHGIDEMLNGRFQCVPVLFGGPSGKTDKVFAIGDCPEAEKNQTLRRLCETNDPEPFTVEAVLPVSDTRSGVVYKNVYCLTCWKRSRPDVKLSQSLIDNPRSVDDHHLKWNIKIVCTVYQAIYKITNLNKFVSYALNPTHYGSNHDPYCTLKYTLDASEDTARLKPKYCYQHNMRSPTPNCSGTTNNDHVISSLCATITKPAYSVANGHNMFCSLCNDKIPQCYFAGLEPLDDGPIISPINFLLGYELADIQPRDSAQTTRVYETYVCSQPLKWMHKEAGCVFPSCTEGKVLDVTIGQCKTAISVIENLGYKLSMVLVPDQKIPTVHAFRIQDEVVRLYSELMESAYLAVYMVVFGTDQTEEYDVIKYVKIQGHFVAKKDIKRDEFEEMFLNYTFKIQLNPLDENSTVTLVAGGMGVDHVGKMGIREYTQGNPEDQYRLPDYYAQDATVGLMADQPVEEPSSVWTPPPSTVSRDSPQPVTFKVLLYAEIGGPKETTYGPIWKKWKNEFIDMTPALLCPFVAFDIKEVSVINETKLLIIFFYNDQEKTINTTVHDMNLTIENRKVKICIDTFREEFQKILISESITNKTDVEITWMSAVKRHLTICCLILSVICLLITSITYCIFSQLRTLPGLNTLYLCLTLASAQLALILVVELVGFIDGYICIALGIALHYTWLCSFCWMGVSCVHMFLVFRGSNTRQSSNRSPAEKHTQYRILAFGTSAVIVSVHICVCEILSDGKTTGYSDQICFFDTGWSTLTVMISFVTPLAIVLVINAVLFGIVVREMVKVRRLQGLRRVKSRDELLTYIKLSTMTGVQWLVSLVAIRFDSHAIDIAVAILVGLQGVFIFVSFTLNKHTRNLYRNLCTGNSTGSSVGSSNSRKGSQSALSTQATDV